MPTFLAAMSGVVMGLCVIAIRDRQYGWALVLGTTSVVAFASAAWRLL